MNNTNTAQWMIARERERQKKEFGYSEEHDDLHVEGQLADAAAVFASWRVREAFQTGIHKYRWPYQKEYHEQIESFSELERLACAGALIIAEMERLMRAKNK